MAGFGFVDDVDLCIMDPGHDGKKVVKQMQESINMWAGLLHATRGALVLEKCFWYYIHNQWVNGKWQYSITPQPHSMMSVLDDNGRLATIRQLPPLEARRTLGVHLALDGSNKDELQYLLKVAKSWQTAMLVAKVMHATAEFGLCQVIL